MNFYSYSNEFFLIYILKCVTYVNSIRNYRRKPKRVVWYRGTLLAPDLESFNPIFETIGKPSVFQIEKAFQVDVTGVGNQIGLTFEIFHHILVPNIG